MELIPDKSTTRLSPFEIDHLLLTMPEAVAVVGGDGRLAKVNQRLCQMFGYDEAGEVQGRLVEGLIPARQRHAHASARGAYQLEPRACTMAAGRVPMGLRRDGSEFPIELNLAPVHVLGQPMTVGVVRDISERVRVERALKISLDDQSARLRGVEHRIRNLLQMLSSLLSLDAQGMEGRMAQVLVELTRQRVSAIALAYGLASESSPDGPRLDLAVYLRELAPRLAEALSSEGLEIHLQLDVTPVLVAMDRGVGIGLVLNQLLGNCLKHAVPEEGRVDRPYPAIDARVSFVAEAIELTVSSARDSSAMSWTSGHGEIEAVHAFVASLGGTFEVKNNRHTSVVVRVPLPLDTGQPAR